MSLKKDAAPLQRIEDTLEGMAGAKYFCTLDLATGFNQIELDEESTAISALTTHLGLFQYKVIPFGLGNAPATFVKLMQTVLKGLMGNICMVYLDDIIIKGKTFHEIMKNLKNHHETTSSHRPEVECQKVQVIPTIC